MQEAGVKGYDFASWFLMLAPSGVPDTVAQRINQDVASVLQGSAVRQRFTELGAEAGSGTPAELQGFCTAGDSALRRPGEAIGHEGGESCRATRYRQTVCRLDCHVISWATRAQPPHAQWPGVPGWRYRWY